MRFIFKKLLLGLKILSILFTTYALIIFLFSFFLNKDKILSANTQNLETQNKQTMEKIVNDPKLNASKKGKVLITLYRVTMCGLIGEICPQGIPDSIKKNNLSSKMSYLVSLPMTNPPASGVYWALAGLENAGFIPKTYASEGMGFASLRPFMNIWKIFRDICYLILVIVLVSIGFMIIFRMKINPQTVISVENALPKIVLSMILITFSFAIAGFLIDFMYVLILIIVSVLSNRGNYFDPVYYQNHFINAGIGKILDGMLPQGFFPTIWNVSNSLVRVLPSIMNQLLRTVLGFASIWIIGGKFEPLFKSLFEKVGDIGGGNPVTEPITQIIDLAGWTAVIVLLGPILFMLGYSILGGLIFVLVMATVFSTFFRIFFLLFSAYLKMFLLIVFSPFFMLFEAIPGKSAFGFWFKSLFAEILTFPVVVTIFMLAHLIINTIAAKGTLWRPPFLTDLNPNSLTIMLAVGILFMTPDLMKLVKQLLGVKDMPIGLSLGTYFGGAATLWGGTQSGLGMFSSLTQMPGIGTMIYHKMNDPNSKAGGVLKTLMPVGIGTQVADAMQRVEQNKQG